MRFNIVDPSRDDFGARAVSEAVEDPAHRAHLEAELRRMIEDRGAIHSAPIATKTHTSEELAEMGFVALTLRSL